MKSRTGSLLLIISGIFNLLIAVVLGVFLLSISGIIKLIPALIFYDQIAVAIIFFVFFLFSGLLQLWASQYLRKNK